jgi:hypothetical protein
LRDENSLSNDPSRIGDQLCFANIRPTEGHSRSTSSPAEVQDGKGKANDIFAGVNGWLVSHDAPKEAIDFMKVWLGKDIQTKLAAAGLSIPMVKATSDAIQNPFYKALALEVNNSGWISVAMDQLLGRPKRVASSTTKLWPSPLVPSLPNRRRGRSKTPGPNIGFRRDQPCCPLLEVAPGTIVNYGRRAA